MQTTRCEILQESSHPQVLLPEFDILLQKAERGCVCVTWFTSPSIATLLQQNRTNVETEFFKKHGIDDH